MELPSGTIAVWSDIGCPWAHVAVHRLLAARERLGLDDAVRLEHLAFPLELFNDRATPKQRVDAEMAVLGSHEPDAGWNRWTARDSEWPVTMLPAMEAVRCAHLQGASAAERLDRALRLAFFRDSRCISLRHVILEVARTCDNVDADRLAADLDRGVARHRVIEEWQRAAIGDVEGSPHLFLPDGSSELNPGMKMHWEGEQFTGFPVVDNDDPSIYDDLLKRATA